MAAVRSRERNVSFSSKKLSITLGLAYACSFFQQALRGASYQNDFSFFLSPGGEVVRLQLWCQDLAEIQCANLLVSRKNYGLREFCCWSSKTIAIQRVSEYIHNRSQRLKTYARSDSIKQQDWVGNSARQPILIFLNELHEATSIKAATLSGSERTATLLTELLLTSHQWVGEGSSFFEVHFAIELEWD